MKKIFLLSASILFITLCNAQLKRTKLVQTGNSDTTWKNLSQKLNRTKITTGNVKLHTEPGKYDLYATFKNKQVTGYYAIDKRGNKIPATYAEKGTKCIACITIENGLNYCYDIDCDDLPKRKPDAVRTAH